MGSVFATELKQRLWQIQDSGDSSVSWRKENKRNCNKRSDWRGRQRSDEGTRPHRVRFVTANELQRGQQEGHVVRSLYPWGLFSPQLLIMLLGQKDWQESLGEVDVTSERSPRNKEWVGHLHLWSKDTLFDVKKMKTLRKLLWACEATSELTDRKRCQRGPSTHLWEGQEEKL